MNQIGGHFTKNGVVRNWPARAILSLNGNGLGEQHEDTIVIVRNTTVFPDGEAPPDFNTFDPEATGITWQVYGEYWYNGRTEEGGNFRDAWAKTPADYYQILNEQGGGGDDAFAIQRTLDIERAIMQAANADGRKCCILNLADGNPDFETWKRMFAPFIIEAWDSDGNIYGRHLYGYDDLILPDGTPSVQVQRVLDELDYLKANGYGGGVVLTETGIMGGYDVADFQAFHFQITKLEQLLRPYADMLIGFCWWECGDAKDFRADYTDHLKQMTPYMEQHSIPGWRKETEPPIPPPVDHAHPELQLEIDVLAAWQKEQDDKLAALTARIETLEAYHKPPETGIIPPPPPGSIIIDVSAYNIVNWQTIKCAGAIVRTSNGMGSASTTPEGVDKRLWEHLEGIAESGRPFGLYHFYNKKAGLNQIGLFIDIVSDAIQNGFTPTMGLWLDFEDGSPDNESVIRSAFEELNRQNKTGQPIGVYSRMSWWNPRVKKENSWPCDLKLQNWTAAWVNSPAHPISVPPSPTSSFLGMHHWQRNKTAVWQFTSAGGRIVGHHQDSLDVGYWYGFGDYWDCNETPPEEPISTDFMIPDPAAWVVVDRGPAGGEDIFTLFKDDQMIRIKNHAQGEWYTADGLWRIRDTSPAPDSQGNDRLYMQTTNGQPGGQIAPAQCEIGKMYTFYSDVQFYRKSDCQPLDENSGKNAPSTFKLVEIRDNYTFTETGLTVDRLWITEQTGETQLYAMKDGRKIGWCGGGARQPGNTWTAVPREIHFDRHIPQEEPQRYCE